MTVTSSNTRASAMAGRTAVHVLSDGSVKMDGGVTFGQVPKHVWQEWMPADRRNRVRLGLNCVLARIGDKNFLIDTGVGQKHSVDKRDDFGIGTSQLHSALKRYGCLPRDIHGVILSSLRFEHTGGCTKVDRKGDIVPAFPKARYFVQKAMWDEATAPNERDAENFIPDDYLPLHQKGVLELVDGDKALVPGIQVRRTGGPCNGHQIVIVTHGGERVAYVGDLVPTPYHLQLSCISSTDRLPEDTLERKREVLREAARDGWLIVFSHGAEQHAGYLENRNGRPVLRPVTLD
ncbi:MAG: MBL fold metallo-hydrolase [SAR202 cluster bacterium]|nr:MBL fold metallo-hydrolase [SAR202 cluster bacterium]